MRAVIDDDLAARFARTFYRALAAGAALDVAVTHARLALFQAGGANRGGAWLVPALFTRLADGRLWPAPAVPLSSPLPQPDAGTGGYTIGAVNAGVFVQGDATFDFRDSSFHFGGGEGTDDRAVLDRLAALERTILARFDRAEQQIVAQTLAGLDVRQRALVDEVLAAVAAQPAPRPEGEALLDAVAALRVELRAQGAELAGQLDALAAPNVAPVESEFEHKLLVTIPLVPFLLDYQTELKLNTRVDLERAWRRSTPSERPSRRDGIGP